ncbi:MAG: type II toxin-antitoxin system Phd/YefM family antitoxin [Pirellulales bacterium]
MTMVSIEEAQANLPEIIEKLGPGQEVVITRDDKPVAQLIPVLDKPKPVFGNCKGMATIIADDDEHLSDFADYMP